MNLLNFEENVRRDLLDYFEYLHSCVTTDLVNTLSERFQVAYENLAQLSTDKLKEIINYFDALEIAW